MSFGLNITYNIFEGFNVDLLEFGVFIYIVGLFGIIYNQNNFLVTIMCVELMYSGIIFLFIVYAVSSHDAKGYIYALICLILAAAESAVGLGILIVLYRFGNSIKFEDFQELRG